MTTGQLVFCSGIGLLMMTIALAILFAVKKPNYNPESIAYIELGDHTQRLRSGYPTERLTIRREKRRTVEPSTVSENEETELLAETELLTDAASATETELIETAQSTTLI